MIEKIEPALTPDEWATKTSGDFSIDGNQLWGQDEQRRGNCWIDAAKAIALANAALRNDDPRKITREMIDALVAAWMKFGQTSVITDRLLIIAEALQSYLPPGEQSKALADVLHSYDPETAT